MKNVRKPNDLEALLNAVLADDDWQALNGTLKREALAAFGVERRRPRLRRSLEHAACMATLLAWVGWWLCSAIPGPAPIAQKPGRIGLSAVGKPFISEEQMLAMFPAGSCVVAEIDGQKELVFFDAKKAEEGFIVGNP